MSLLGLAMIVAISTAEPCVVVRREQGEFNGRLFARLDQINRAARRPDGSQRPLTAAQRKEFAAIEAEVESFITRFNTRLNNWAGD